MVMVADTFTCAQCHETFARSWTDAEAMMECKAIFGDVPREDLVMVCDDCYQQLMAVLN